MKSTKFIDEMKNKSLEQLQQELVTAKRELFQLRFKNATNQLDKPSKIRTVKRNIARINTLMVQKKEVAKAWGIEDGK